MRSTEFHTVQKITYIAAWTSRNYHYSDLQTFVQKESVHLVAYALFLLLDTWNDKGFDNFSLSVVIKYEKSLKVFSSSI